MKILTVVFDLDKGGTKRAAQIFAEAYKMNGHDSRILTFYGLGSRYEEIKDFINVWYEVSENNLEEIKKWSPDIIHIHSHGLKKKDVENMLDVLQDGNVKVIEQSVFSIPSPWESRLDFSFQLSSWALWLYNLRGGDRNKSCIVPCPVNCKNFYHRDCSEIKNFKEKYNIPENAFVIGRIGQSSYGKWSTMLIDCFNEIAQKRSDFYMVVVNPPINIIDKINDSPFKNRIINIEKIYGDDNLSVVYSSFDLMVHIAEQGESFGYVLAEALLCETPVVTLSTPWGDNSQCEVVKNKIGGYVVNGYNGIIAAVNNYIELKNNDKINLKKSCRNHVILNYEYKKVAADVINCLLLKNNLEINNSNITNKIITILKDTFDKVSLFTVFLIKSNILFLRILTIYRYPVKLIFIKLSKKIVKIFYYKN